MISHFGDDENLIDTAVWNDADKSIIVTLKSAALPSQTITFGSGNKEDVSGNKMTKDIVATFNGVSWQ